MSMLEQCADKCKHFNQKCSNKFRNLLHLECVPVYHIKGWGKFKRHYGDFCIGADTLMQARDEKRLLRFQKQMASYELLLVDELGFVPLSKTGAELLFEVFSLRYERGSTLVTSNLPFQEWTEVLGSERLTGALLDRLTHHVHILEMNGESYPLKQSRRKRTPSQER